MLRSIPTIIFAMAVCLHATSAQGGVIMSIDSISLNAGQTGAVDVWIENGTSDLQSYGIQFGLESLAAGSLIFDAPQVGHLTNPDYLFLGDSASDSLSLMGDSVDTTVFSSDTFTGGDFTNSGSNVSLSSRRLLATLYVTASATAAPGAYKITLNTLVSTFSNANADSLDLVVPLDGVFGTVTVTGVQTVSTVPEPTSALGICILGCLAFLRRRFKRDENRNI